jgi:4-hydroxybenzoate polyprenyltransferase
MVYNDVADRQEDQLQRPERPLPRGDISVASAVALGALLIGVALLCSPVPSHHALLATLALAYDFVLKRNRALAALTMATLRGANLATAGLLAFAPSSGATSSVLAAPALGTALQAACICYGVYIGFVTVLGILEDAAQPRQSVVLLAQSVPPVAALTGIAIVSKGLGLASLLAAALLLAFFARMLRIASWDRRSIRGSMTWLLLGTMCYTALLAVAAGSLALGLGIAACIAPARRLSRWISLT